MGWGSCGQARSRLGQAYLHPIPEPPVEAGD
jgi:hypothetical protein